VTCNVQRYSIQSTTPHLPPACSTRTNAPAANLGPPVVTPFQAQLLNSPLHALPARRLLVRLAPSFVPCAPPGVCLVVCTNALGSHTSLCSTLPQVFPYLHYQLTALPVSLRQLQANHEPTTLLYTNGRVCIHLSSGNSQSSFQSLAFL